MGRHDRRMGESSQAMMCERAGWIWLESAGGSAQTGCLQKRTRGPFFFSQLAIAGCSSDSFESQLASALRVLRQAVSWRQSVGDGQFCDSQSAGQLLFSSIIDGFFRRLLRRFPVRRLLHRFPVRRLLRQFPVGRLLRRFPVGRLLRRFPVGRLLRRFPVRWLLR